MADENISFQPADSLLRQFLADRDVPCPGCTYNLRSLTCDHCPECHQQIELTVGLVEPRMALFIAGVVGLASGFGAGVSMVITVFLLSVIFNEFAPLGFFLIPLGWASVEGAGMLALTRRSGRVWFRTASDMTRLVVVGGAWLATGLFVIAIVLYLSFMG